LAKNDDLSAQASLEQSINDTIASRAGLLKQMNAEMSAQLQMQLELCAACEAGPDYAGKTEELGGMTEALKSAGDAAAEGAGGADKMSQALGKAGKSGGKAGKSFMKMGAVVGMFAGIASAAKKVQAVVSAMTGGLSTAVSFIQKTATGVFSGLSNTMGWLASKAQEGGGGARAIASAYEELKDTVGGAGDEFNAAHAAIDNLQSGSATAAMSGVNLATIYGKNTGGVAKAIKDVGTIMGEAGNQVQYLTELMEKNTGAMLLANKALGLNGQTLAAFGKNASLTGTDVGEFTDSINLQTAYMSKKFGINVKKMGKNIGEMTKDFATFGTMTPKELATTAAYADKLGISIKGLQGITAKTDDFEGAAMAAAELAGSFGMTIDAMDLMTADPAEKAEMVRKAFQETGKDFATMSRQEKARMAEITAMGADELAGMFDPANADIGLDDMEKAADEAANGAMTQQEATEELTKSIKKLIETSSGLTKSKGPFDALLNGFTAGIMKSKEMRAIFSNLRKTMAIMYNLGKQLGQAFIDLFPGVKDLLGGVAALFDPERYGTFAASISKALAIFRKTKDIKTFIDSIKAAFTAFFGSGGEAMKKIKAGVKKMVIGIIDGLALLLPMAIGALTSMVSGITKWLLEPKKEVEEGATEGFGTAIWNAIKGLGAALLPALGDLAKAVGTLFKTLWKEKRKEIIAVGKAALGGLLGALFMGGVGGALKGALIGKMGGMVKDKLGKTLNKGFKDTFADSSKSLSKLGANMGDDAAKMGSKIFAKMGNVMGKVGGPLAVAGVAISMSEMRDKMDSKFAKDTGEAEKKAGMMAAGIVNFLTMGLVPDDILLKIGQMTADITTSIGEMMDKIGLGGIWDTQMEIWGGIFDWLAGLGDVIVGIFTGDSDKVAAGFKSMWSGVFDVVMGFQKQIWEWAKLLLPMLGKSLLWVWGMAFKLIFMYIPKAIWTLIKGLGTAIVDGLMAIKDMVITAFIGIWKFITDGEFRDQMVLKMINAAEDMVNGLIDGLSSAIAYVAQWAADLWGEFKAFWGINSDSTVMAEAGDNMVGGIMSTLSALPQKILAMANEAWDFLTGVFDKAYDIGSEIVAGIVGGMANLGSSLLAIGEEAWGAVTGFFGIASPSKKAGEMGDQITAGMVDGLNAIPEKMFSVFKKGLDIVLELFGLDGLKPIVDNVFNVMKDVAMSVITPFLEMQGILMDVLIAPFTTAFDVIHNLFTGGIGAAVDAFVDGVKGAFMNIVNLVEKVGEVLLNYITMPWRMAANMIHEFLPGKMKEVVDRMKDIVLSGVEKISGLFGELGSKLLGPVMHSLSAIKKLFVDVFSGKGIKNSLKTMLKEMKKSLKNVIKVFKQVGPKIINSVTDMLDDIWDLFDEYFDMDTIKEKMEGMLKGIKAAAGKVKAMIAGPFEAAWKVVSNLMSFSSMKTSGENMIKGIGTGLGGLAAKVLESAAAAWTIITNHFNFGLMQEAGASMVRGIANGLSNLGSTLYDLAVDAVSQLMNPFEGSPIDAPTAPSGEIGAGLKDGVMKGISSLPEELKAAGGDAMKALEEGMGADGSSNEAMINAVIAPVSNAISAVQEAQNNIHEILNNLAPIDLDAVISRTADELAVKNKTVSIQHKPVTITVNMNVTMSAEDIATALVEGKYVMQGDASTPPGQ
jgi:hypothetical protein